MDKELLKQDPAPVEKVPCSCGHDHEHEDHSHDEHEHSEEPCSCGHDHEHEEHSHDEHEHDHDTAKRGVASLTGAVTCACGHDHGHDEHEHDEHEHNDHNHDHSLSDGITCSCGHDHGHEEDGGHEGHTHGVKSIKGSVVSLVVSVVICFIAAQLSGTAALALFIGAYLIAGREVLITAAKNISKGQVFDENFLMVVATIGAFAIGEWSEAVAVMIFYHIGEILQQLAVDKSKKNIESLMDIRPDYANVLSASGEVNTLDPFDVKIGDLLLVKPGEKIPLDGLVVKGAGSVDTSMLTGESLPVEIEEGSAVLSGSVNLTGSITVKVTSEYEHSTVQKILTMVSEASGKKAETERFITKFAKYYTPAVMAVAAAIAFVPPFLLGMGAFSDWLYRGLVFLVVSCPCALIISIPVGFLGGIGCASKNGVLVKGGNFLEQFEHISTIVFDKTGTLTSGSFSVVKAQVFSGDEKQLQKAVLMAEGHSSHPIALCIKKHFEDENFVLPNEAQYENIGGKGVICTFEGKQYSAGNEKLMTQLGLKVETVDEIGSVLYVAQDQTLLGKVVVADTVKAGVADDIVALRGLGVKKLYMLTGDNEKTAKAIAQQVGLDGYKAQLLPDEKVTEYEKLMDLSPKAVNVFVGDGINDAPLLARSDIGVAMGAIGSDAAIEAADVVLMTDEIKKLAQGIQISRFTKKIVWQNVIFSLGVKIGVMIIAAFGKTPMWLAIFADVGVAVLAVLNATRALNHKVK